MGNSGGVFRLNGNLVTQDFFLLSKLYLSLEILLELVEIHKLYDLDLFFLCKEKNNWFMICE